jgi:hypothetical protein
MAFMPLKPLAGSGYQATQPATATTAALYRAGKARRAARTASNGIDTEHRYCAQAQQPAQAAKEATTTTRSVMADESLSSDLIPARLDTPRQIVSK